MDHSPSIEGAAQGSAPGVTRSALAGGRWQGCALGLTRLALAVGREQGRALDAISRRSQWERWRVRQTMKQVCTAVDQFVIRRPALDSIGVARVRCEAKHLPRFDESDRPDRLKSRGVMRPNRTARV